MGPAFAESYGAAGEQMKRDIGSGKLDDVLHEVEEDIKSGRTREMP
jgi:hypothetical protein